MTEYQSIIGPIYNGWVLFACLVYAFAIFPTFGQALLKRRAHLPLMIASALCAICSLYLLLIGIYLAVDWVDPFAGKENQMSSAIHNPKGWIIVAVIVVWPYLLILLGLALGYLGVREFGRARRVLGRAI